MIGFHFNLILNLLFNRVITLLFFSNKFYMHCNLHAYVSEHIKLCSTHLHAGTDAHMDLMVDLVLCGVKRKKERNYFGLIFVGIHN